MKTEKCTRYNLSPSYCYKKFKCRCHVCLSWKKESACRTNNKELAKERSRVWRLNNLSRSRKNSADYQKKHPDKVLKWQLNKYGISTTDYEQMLLKQGGCCAICGGSIGGMQHGNSRLCIDHDHSTGKFRGLLCGACNIGIGHLKHSVSLLINAIEYLNNNGGDVYV